MRAADANCLNGWEWDIWSNNNPIPDPNTNLNTEINFRITTYTELKLYQLDLKTKIDLKTEKYANAKNFYNQQIWKFIKLSQDVLA